MADWFRRLLVRRECAGLVRFAGVLLTRIETKENKVYN